MKNLLQRIKIFKECNLDVERSSNIKSRSDRRNTEGGRLLFCLKNLQDTRYLIQMKDKNLFLSW